MGDEHLVAQMISLLGKLEKEWQPKWKRMQLSSEQTRSDINYIVGVIGFTELREL
jgi:hypothetical protein